MAAVSSSKSRRAARRQGEPSLAPARPVFPVSVRELVEFVLRRGGLGGERDFVGRGRALAGTRGHQQLQRSRPAGYQKELTLVREVETEDVVLRVQGRIDGVLVTPEGVLLEEIKTVQGRGSRAPDPLHWAQAKIYGCIYGQAQGLEHLTLQLTYLDLPTGEVTEWREVFTVADLADFFTATTAVFLEWVRERHRWCRQRDASIHSIEFPFPAYRPGQRQLAVAAYRTLAHGGRLFLEAPTGIGKTMAVLFPALKALAEGRLERLFYLTARTVGRMVAGKALDDLRQTGLRLRSVTLIAREKLCVQEGKPCDPQTCPLAVGYYDRRHPAMREALSREGIDRAVLEAVALEHQVCPFALSQDLSVWVDAVVGDYNYLFDPRVYLRRHFAETAREYGFLIDEAHNLVDRAREMFSASLGAQEIREVSRAVKAAAPRCAKALTRLASALRKLSAPAGGAGDERAVNDLGGEADLFGPKPAIADARANPAGGDGLPLASDAGASGHPRIRREFPAALLPLLETALAEAEAWLARNEPALFREELLELYFRLHSFLRTAELFDENFVSILEAGPAAAVRLFCLDPSRLLRQALDRGKAAVFFSATLTPIDYYRRLLGGETGDPQVRLPSPFPSENLAVLVHERIRTHFKARTETRADVAQAIGALVRGRSGNYLVYLPSHQYLQSIHEQFQVLYPETPLLVQRSVMTESEREGFLAAFTADRAETLVGFAVMGGIFGEGIDLVGDRLIGAVVVGVGLPQPSVERDLIRDHFQEKNGSGYDYAYLFPGLNRVLQATGRVIRSETDRGVVLLLDTRFAQLRYQSLFPAWWNTVRVRTVSEIETAVQRFWLGKPCAEE